MIADFVRRANSHVAASRSFTTADIGEHWQVANLSHAASTHGCQTEPSSSTQMSPIESLAFYGIGELELEDIRRFGKRISMRASELVDVFYEWLQTLPEFDQFFGSEELLGRVKHQQRQYWLDFLKAEVNEEYLAKRRQVGEIHATIGLPLESYFGSMNHCLGWLIEALHAQDFPPEESLGIQAALTKLVHLDTAVVVETYSKRTGEIIADRNQSMTEMKRHQGQIIQYERLRALGEMASGIAHDINNSLSIISIFTNIGIRQQEVSEKARNCFQKIAEGVKDATSVIGRMRDFYRPREAGEALTPVDISLLVSEVVELTKPKWKDQSEATGIRTQIETELLTDKLIQGNEGELREVLTNLIFNALDASPGGGEITIRTEDDGDFLTLSVSDNGVGMDEHTRKRVFEPFFTTKGDAGTGLGLSVTWGILQRHNCEPEVESEPGTGTTFKLAFPLTSGVQTMTPASVIEPLPPLQILCVDDEELIRTGMEDLLSDMGHSVDAVASAEEAIVALVSKEYDVVISDLGMPNVSGHMLAKQIKETRPDLPIILLTGWGDHYAERELDEIDIVLSKPADEKDLEKALRTVLNQP